MASSRTKIKWVMPRDAEGRPIVDAYLRMSDGFDGKQDNRENQLADIMPLYEQNNWVLGEVLQDEVSAWKRGVRRDDFEKLLKRIESGESAGAAFYNQDRFLRRPADLERFLSLWEDGRDELIVASMFGKIDLRDNQQRAFMRNVAAMAMSASDDTSRRAKRKNAGKRERGLLGKGGPRAFGWDDDKVDREQLKAEQDALKAAYVDIDAGVSLAKVSARLNEAGLLSFYGKPWSETTLRNTMARGRYAGWIEHDGEIVGKIADHKPLIDPELWERVQTLFASRRRGRPKSGRHLASGLLHCSECGASMTSRPQYQGKRAIPTYRCNTGCGGVAVQMAGVDQFLRDLTITALSDPRIAEGVSAIMAERNTLIVETRAKLEAAQAREVSLAAKLAAEEISDEAWEVHHDATFARIKRLKQELAELEAAAGNAKAVRTESRESIAADWDAAIAGGRVDDARALLVRALRGRRLIVVPSGARYPTDPKGLRPHQRVRILRRKR